MMGVSSGARVGGPAANPPSLAAGLPVSWVTNYQTEHPPTRRVLSPLSVSSERRLPRQLPRQLPRVAGKLGQGAGTVAPS